VYEREKTEIGEIRLGQVCLGKVRIGLVYVFVIPKIPGKAWHNN
jgi:hypothetical protein